MNSERKYHYVYILRSLSIPNAHYTGSTQDLHDRLAWTFHTLPAATGCKPAWLCWPRDIYCANPFSALTARQNHPVDTKRKALRP
jgi:hypothetical protein